MSKNWISKWKRSMRVSRFRRDWHYIVEEIGKYKRLVKDGYV